MARINIDLPHHFDFETEISVRASDLNYGGHLGNDTLLTLLQEARIHFYRSLGFKDEVSFEGSVGQIITDAAIQYKSEAFLGDILVVAIATRDFNKYGFDLVYRVTNKQTATEVARGKTGIICFDYSKRKIATIPPSLLSRLRKDNR